MSESPRLRNSNRWITYSLRSLLLLLSLAAALFAYIAYERRQSDQEQRAYKTLDALNGIIKLQKNHPQRPPWLQSILGDDSFSYVESIDLSGDPSYGETNPTDEKLRAIRFFTRTKEINFENMTIHDESLKPLSGFHQLESLAISRCQFITDEGLAHISNLPRLERLDLSDMEAITDRGMLHLSRLPRLKFLDLSSTGIGDDGLEFIARNKTLESIGLDETRVTHEGMKHIANLPSLWRISLTNVEIGDRGLESFQNLQLKSLNLYGARVTDHSLPTIGRMKNLQSLNLGTAVASTTHPAARRTFAPIPEDATPSQISDDGLKHLVDLTELESLDLSNSQITDLGLRSLRRMKKLDTLDLTGCRITDTGLIELQELPELNLLFVESTDVTKEGAKRLAQKLDNVHVSITINGRHLNVGKNY